jgi:hypothetical protein
MKLVVCDIDGTLIDSPGQKLPSARLIKTIYAVKDKYLVTCATGRSRSWAKPVLSAAHFTAPCILGGGTHIVDQTSQAIIWEQPLPPSTLESIKATLRDHPDVRVIFNDYTEDDYLSGGWPLEKLMAAKEVFLMEVVMITDELASQLIERFRALPGVTSLKLVALRPGVVDIHVLHETVSKEHAIGRIQKMTGISKVDTIGIGDGHNDFHIFNAVGTKVAVANAVPDLKARADIVIGDVANDAVAAYLESLIS